MKVVHWVGFTNSGMHMVAKSLQEHEKKQGIDSVLVNPFGKEFEEVKDADIYVVHTHLPEEFLWDGTKIVWVSHGTPEVMFRRAQEEALVDGRYGHGDSFMLMQFWLQNADAVITQWPRHQKILASMCDKGRAVHYVPMGVELDFWKPIESNGKFSGSPSVLTCENQYWIKWYWDLFVAWSFIMREKTLHGARLHANYCPTDQHRMYFPLVNRNGVSFTGFISNRVFGKDELRNALCSTDFYVNLVKYGDYNRMTLEAKACGAKVIAYRGNPYADYWITEGDQEQMAVEMVKIFKGETEPRETSKVPSMEEMALGFMEVYKKI